MTGPEYRAHLLSRAAWYEAEAEIATDSARAMLREPWLAHKHNARPRDMLRELVPSLRAAAASLRAAAAAVA